MAEEKKLTVRLSLAELGALRERARREGRSLTMVVRRALGYAKKHQGTGHNKHAGGPNDDDAR